MRLQTSITVLFLLAALHGMAEQARAQTETDPVDEGRRALKRSANFPWYDASSDSLRRIDVEATPPPQPPRQTASSGGAAPRKPRFSLAWLWTFLSWAVVVLLAVGLVILAIYAIRYMAGGDVAIAGSEGDAETLKSEIDRIESLPFRVKRPFSDLLSEARRCYEAGNYNEAIIYLYSYQLVHLDKRHLIRLAKGKTNRQYVREVRPREGISDLLSQTMLAFEEVFFGDHDLPRPRFEHCWNHLDKFHQMVDKHTAA